MTGIDIADLTKKIKKKAVEIGFDLVGVCSADTFERAKSVLKKRKLSEFINPDLELLTDPRKHLASAKSIISLGLSYAAEMESTNEEEQDIALYARGMDYHYIMKEMMNSLIDFLKEQKKDLEYISYSDTGTILDREIACRAGLGWIGKSNNLINDYYGSYLILGEILTNTDLVFDNPVEDRCGDCSLCIENCPAEALKEYNLQVDRCRSYLTQKKGILSEEERNIIGKQLWGCDRCLEVCPYNKGIPVNLHKEFLPRLKGDYKQILVFTKENFPEEWKKSALSWRGLNLLKRNTIINIVNTEKTDYITLLKKELKNPSPIIRAYSAWALVKLGADDIENCLRKHYYREKDQAAKKEIRRLFLLKGWSDQVD
ncbi:MAG: tRNA epoxyqueuosine(34) reductase QueG [Halanaerobiaceae bacterium]|nr:tRNA epoxyqueuosine(34) reductase QueG [Halanaerobiaceae bacterium]